jgi:hypothetical protein
VIGTEELKKALLHIGQMEAYGPPAHVWIPEQGVDYVSLEKFANDHADTLMAFGFISKEQVPTSAMSFMAGFTIALEVLQNDRNTNV